MEYKCPKCDNHTYTWGNPLPGQFVPKEGMFDDRLRSNISCVSCDWTEKLKA